jgi:hypothetical protein
MVAGIACCIGVATGTSLKASGTNFDADDAMAFEQNNLDAILAGGAKFLNANLTNAWGLALAPGGAFWVNGNRSGTSSLIKGDGAVVTTLVVSIPSPSGKISAPTGILANPTTGALLRLDGKPVRIDRLWAPEFGGGALSNPEQLFFSAAPNDENNGLFGVISATPRDKYRTAD